jgi:hypothetical protein
VKSRNRHLPGRHGKSSRRLTRKIKMKRHRISEHILQMFWNRH